MNCPGAIKTFLMRAGVRPSVQRIAVAKYLVENRCHPTVDDVYSALLPDYPTLSRTTVYNTARLLADSGCINAFAVDAEGMRLDAETNPHSHFVCRKCGRIFDLPPTELPALPEGYNIDSMRVSFYGVCRECNMKVIDSKPQQ